MVESVERPNVGRPDEATILGADFVITARPTSFDGFVGQEPIIATLQALVASAKARDIALEHMLFIGQAGCGKQALAGVLAYERGLSLKPLRAQAIERAGDLAAILTNLRNGDILLIQDMHLLNHACADVLGPAMTDFVLDVVIGKGPGARNIRLKLPRFTIIGTTHLPSLIPPAIARAYPLVFRFQEYSVSELGVIIQRSAWRLGLETDTDSAQAIAALSKGVPRHALQLLRLWVQLSQAQIGDLSPEQVLKLLAQRAQDYETVRTPQAQEREAVMVQVGKMLRQLESDLNERLDQLESRIDELRDALA